MATAFITAFNMSVCSAWLIILLLALRPIFKRAPRSVYFPFWFLLGVRLVFPLVPNTAFSIIPSADTIPKSIITDTEPYIHSGIFFINNTVNPLISENLTPVVQNSANPIQTIISIASYIWLAGIALMFLYIIISYILLRKKTRASLSVNNNVYTCDYISTPFTSGIFKPRIYLPSDTRREDVEFILDHERSHIKRLDLLWKLCGFLILSIHWFNPFVWAAYLLFCRDIEYACDESVIKSKGNEYRRNYSEALVNCSSAHGVNLVYPLTFGKTSVKNRINRILKYEKPKAPIYFISLLLCILIALLFMTNPISAEAENSQLPLSGDISYSFRNEHQYASIGINTDTKNFTFMLAFLCSNIPSGEYEESEKYLVLNADDEGLRYVFEKNGDNLIFIADLSSPLPKYKYSAESDAVPCIPDRAVFRPDS